MSEEQHSIDLPSQPVLVWTPSRRAHKVALLAGTNSNEGAALTFLTRPAATVVGYREYLKARFGDALESAFGMYSGQRAGGGTQK